MPADRYSLLRYSVNVAEQTIEIADDHFTTFDVIAGPSIIVIIQETYNETIKARLTGAVALPEDAPMHTELYAQTSGTVIILIDDEHAFNLNQNAAAGKSVRLDEQDDTALYAKIAAGQKIRFAEDYFSALHINSTAGKEIEIYELHTTALEGLAGGSKVDILAFTLAITLAPGEEVLINTETYEVFVGTENALEYQDGEWLTVERDAISLTIESGTGGSMAGNLAYVERYL